MARLGKLLALLALFAACAHGFSGPVAARSTLSRAAVHMEVQRINKGIDLDSPKVVNQVDLDGKSVFCRCWQSKTFPLCDGAHVKHNEATGDNVGPLIVSVKKD